MARVIVSAFCHTTILTILPWRYKQEGLVRVLIQVQQIKLLLSFGRVRSLTLARTPERSKTFTLLVKLFTLLEVRRKRLFGNHEPSEFLGRCLLGARAAEATRSAARRCSGGLSKLLALADLFVINCPHTHKERLSAAPPAALDLKKAMRRLAGMNLQEQYERRIAQIERMAWAAANYGEGLTWEYPSLLGG